MRCCATAPTVSSSPRAITGAAMAAARITVRFRGADDSLPHVLTPTQVMQGKPVPGRRVLILDGDGHFMGIALAELMANQGKEVTYVCDASDVAEYGVFTMESANNKRMLFEKGVKTYCNHWVERIEPEQVRLTYLYKFGPDLNGPSAGRVPRQDNARRIRPRDRRRDPGDRALLRRSSVARIEGAQGRMGGQRDAGRFSARATARRPRSSIRPCGMHIGWLANSTARIPPIRCRGSASVSCGAARPSPNWAMRG